MPAVLGPIVDIFESVAWGFILYKQEPEKQVFILLHNIGPNAGGIMRCKFWQHKALEIVIMVQLRENAFWSGQPILNIFYSGQW